VLAALDEGEVAAGIGDPGQLDDPAAGPPDAQVLTLIGRAATGVVIAPLGVDRQVGLRRAPSTVLTSSSSAAQRGA
jgi:hypothetical protein